MYLIYEPVGNVRTPTDITEAQCLDFSVVVVDNTTATAGPLGAELVGIATVDCLGQYVKVCFTFKSDEDGAAFMQDAGGETYAKILVSYWLGFHLGGSTCPAWLDGYSVSVTMAGDGVPPVLPDSCANATVSQACTIQPPSFPKCE